MTRQATAGPGILRSSGLLAVSTIISAAGQFALVWYMARYRGPVFLGAYGVVAVLIDIATVVYSSGAQPLIMRKAARRQRLSGALVGTALLEAAAMSLISTAVIALLPVALGYTPDVIAATLVAALTLIPECIRRTGELIAIGTKREHYVAFITLGTAAIQTIAAAAALAMGGELVHVFGVIVVGAVLGAGVYLWLLGRWIRPQRMWTTPRMLLAWARLWWPLFWMGAIGIASYRLDLPILTRLGGLEDGGIYTAALKAVKPLILLRPAVFKGFFPGFVRLFAADRDSGLRATHNTVRLVSTTLSMLALVAVGVAGPVVAWVYGPDFAATAVALQIMAWGLPALYAYALAVSVLLASGRERIALRIHGVNLVAEVVLGLALAPLLGAAGMAIVYSLVRILSAAQLWLVLHRERAQLNLGKALWGPMLTAAAMSFPMFLLTQNAPPPTQIAVGVLAGALYGAVALVAGFITRHDLAPLMRVLKSRHGLG